MKQRDEYSDEPRSPHRSGARSELSGSARDVVQARNVSGGVHFHRPPLDPSPVPRQLPGDAYGFVNRTAEIQRLDEALAHEEDDHAMTIVVITGTAGVGKTSLAVHWAHRIRDRFPDGQLYVNLRGYDPGEPVEPDEVLDRFLLALGLSADAIPAASQAKQTAYRSLVADRRVLIVVDNAMGVRQVRPLLPGSPSCLVLVTSRSRLSGLVARDGARRIQVDVLAPAAAVELLRGVTGERHQDDSSRELSELARLCACLPLALRIAAERAASRPQMPLGELISDLRDESELWAALSAEDDEEADAVHAVFAWSYRALPQDAARLFCLLGLHPGPDFSVPGAAALAGESLNRTRHLLDVLVGAHLIEQHAPGRYQFHTLLRAYSADRAQHLEDMQVIGTARARLFTWYLHTASSVAGILHTPWTHIQLAPITPGVTSQPIMDHEQALRWFQAEQENILAVTRAAAKHEMDQIAWQLPAVLREVYGDRNPPGDWLALGGIGLEAASRAQDRFAEALFLETLGRTLRHSGQLTDAVSVQENAVSAWRNVEDRSGEARSVHNLGLTYAAIRRFDDAEARVADGLKIATEINDEIHAAVATMSLGWLSGLQENFARSLELLNQALPLLRSYRHNHEPTCLMLIAEAERGLGRSAEALEYAEAALDAARRLADNRFESEHLISYARVLRANGRHGDALAAYHYCASLNRSLGDRTHEAMALDGTGETYREMAQPEMAMNFHGQAVTMLRQSEDRWQLAVALDHLATCLEMTGDMAAAREAWSEAVSLITDFPDDQAARLHDRIAGQRNSNT
jgi:tetratricopeptide (TPR) repeat protein